VENVCELGVRGGKKEEGDRKEEKGNSWPVNSMVVVNCLPGGGQLQQRGVLEHG